ncbi:hypothetical protein [Yinghuangia aomiensis]
MDTALWFSFADYDKLGDRDTASHGVVACWTGPAGNGEVFGWRPAEWCS